MPTHLHLRLALKHADPAVVRELEMPADYSCYELHLALQVSLGWNDREDFELVRRGLTVGTEGSYAGAGLTHDGHRYRHADEVEARELFGVAGQTVTYTYDFARLWGFDLTLLATAERETELPRCTRVEGLAPLEDADDLETWYGLLLAYADPAIALHDAAVQILGEDFAGEPPSAAVVTEHLEELFAEEVEPVGSSDDDDDWGWWDPSKYDDRMRLRVKQQEIDEELPADLSERAPRERYAELLRVLRGGR